MSYGQNRGARGDLCKLCVLNGIITGRVLEGPISIGTQGINLFLLDKKRFLVVVCTLVVQSRESQSERFRTACTKNPACIAGGSTNMISYCRFVALKQDGAPAETYAMIMLLLTCGRCTDGYAPEGPRIQRRVCKHTTCFQPILSHMLYHIPPTNKIYKSPRDPPIARSAACHVARNVPQSC